MRRLIPWFILLFPALELWVLIQVGKEIGALATIALIILSVMVGFALLRMRGARIAGGMQAELAAGRIPSNHILDTFCLIAAGWLFLFPGFVSDVIALLLLIPFVRTLLFGLVASKLASGGFSAQTMHYTSASGESGDVRWTCTTFGGDAGQQPQEPRGNAVIIDCEPQHLEAGTQAQAPSGGTDTVIDIDGNASSSPHPDDKPQT